MIFALLTVNHIFVRLIRCRPYSCFSFSSPPPPAIMLIINKTSVFPRFQHSNQNISYIVGKRTAPGFIRRQQIQRQRQIQRNTTNTETNIKTKTEVKKYKSCTIFSKSRECKDIKYDIHSSVAQLSSVTQLSS